MLQMTLLKVFLLLQRKQLVIYYFQTPDARLRQFINLKNRLHRNKREQGYKNRMINSQEYHSSQIILAIRPVFC